jgi:hypothetical protein
MVSESCHDRDDAHAKRTPGNPDREHGARVKSACDIASDQTPQLHVESEKNGRRDCKGQ